MEHMRTVTARVVLNVTVFVSDNAKNFDGTPLTDQDAVSTVFEALLMNDTLALNPDNIDDFDTFGHIEWNEPGVTEIEVTS